MKFEPLAPEQCTTQPFDPFFTCSICLAVVTPDMIECGHCDKLNCKACIDDWKKKANNCPNCRADLTPSKPNRFVVNTLNEFVFACSKCPKTFKYAEHAKHIKECNTTLRCPIPLCGTIGGEAELLTHWRTKCEHIKITCSSCGTTGTRMSVAGKDHDCTETLLEKNRILED